MIMFLFLQVGGREIRQLRYLNQNLHRLLEALAKLPLATKGSEGEEEVNHFFTGLASLRRELPTLEKASLREATPSAMLKWAFSLIHPDLEGASKQDVHLLAKLFEPWPEAWVQLSFPGIFERYITGILNIHKLPLTDSVNGSINYR